MAELCFRFKVLVLYMLAHCHDLLGQQNRAIVNVVSNTCAFPTVTKCLL